MVHDARVARRRRVEGPVGEQRVDLGAQLVVGFVRRKKEVVGGSVEAVQRGEVIFKMGASFCNARESSPLAHQRPMPDVPPPDGLPTLADVLAGLLRRMPEGPAAKLRETAAKFPLDLRFIPEDMTFERKLRDEARAVPPKYKLPAFAASALQNSTVTASSHPAITLTLTLITLTLTLTR